MMYLICMYLLIVCHQSSGDILSKRYINNQCIETNLVEKVFYGWPYRISCGDLYRTIDEMLKAKNISNATHLVTCIIDDVDKGLQIFNQTVSFDRIFKAVSYEIPDFNSSISLNYKIHAWIQTENGICCSRNLKLIGKNFSQSSCDQTIDNITKINREGVFADSVVFLCRESEIHITKNTMREYSVSWYRNCEKLSKSSYQSSDDGFGIQSLSFEFPGIYSCGVTHKGMTRFITHYQLCINEEVSLSQNHGIVCSKNIYKGRLGNEIIIDCTTNFQPSQIVLYEVTWKKKEDGITKNEFICKDYIKKSRDNEISRILCYSNYDYTCWYNKPMKNGKNLPMVNLKMKLHIRQLKTIDFGEYEVTISASGIPATGTLILLEEKNLDLISVSILIGLCIAFVLIIILTLSVLWKFRIYFLIFWKRKFGPFVLEEKEFDAYLSYHFSWEIDQFSQEQIRDAASTVREILLKLGYKIYEESKDYCEIEAKGDSYINVINQCHRVVIILSTNFLKDQWNLFTLQKGFDEMIYSNTKLIFILIPGMKEYLRQYANYDDTVRMVWSAVKINSAIDWSNDSKFDLKVFSLLLEHKMPKLPTQNTNRHSSNLYSITPQINYKLSISKKIRTDTRLSKDKVAVNEDSLKNQKKLQQV